MSPQRAPDAGGATGRFDELPLALRAGLLPALLGGSWLLIQVPLFRVLARSFCSIPFHELGHAFFAWLGGRRAIPTGVFVPNAAFTYWTHERSYWLAILFQGLAGWGTLKLWRGGFAVPALALGGVLMAMLRMTYGIPLDRVEGYSVLGGIAGEFLLTGAVIALFHHRLPDRLRWDFFRFLPLVPACMGFVTSFTSWAAIAAGTQPLPRGSLLWGPDDSNGDIDLLLRLHGWTEASLISFMTQLRWAVLVLIAVYYITGVFKPARRPNAPP